MNLQHMFAYKLRASVSALDKKVSSFEDYCIFPRKLKTAARRLKFQAIFVLQQFQFVFLPEIDKIWHKNSEFTHKMFYWYMKTL